MSKGKKNNFYGFILIAILVLAAFVRLAYVNYAGGGIILEPDSQGYYVEHTSFTDDFLHNFFNVNRTPGYTMFTSLALGITDHGHPIYKSPQFFSGTWIIIVIQTILGLIGLIILYDTLIALHISIPLCIAFTAFTGLNIYQFIWERAFLTEAMYIFIFICLMRLFVRLMKKPTPGTGILFTILAIYGFEVRPAGLLLPFILLPIVWLMHRTKKVFMLVAGLLLIYSSVPVAHLEMNKALYNFKGLSINTDFAVFGRFLHYNLPVDSAAGVQPLYDQVTAYRAAGGNTTIPWYFFVANNNEVYDHMADLQKFDSLVLRADWPAFVRTMIGDIPTAFSDTYVQEVLYRSPTPNPSRTLFDVLTFIVRALQQTTVIFLLFFPFSVWLFIKKQTITNAFLLTIALIEMYQLVASLIYGGPWEFARHMITTQTYLFFFCFWWVGKCVSWLRRRVIQ